MKPSQIVKIVCLLFAAMLPVALHAQTYTNNYGIWNYQTNGDGTCTITGYTGSGGVVTLPSTIGSLPVTCIGDWAFGDSDITMTGLASVTIPNTVTSIGNWAFAKCSNLINVLIPNSVTNIGDSAFAWSTNLTAITVDPSNSIYSDVAGVLFNQDATVLVQYPAGITGNYTIPDSVTNIGYSAFGGSFGLNNVMIPAKVKGIGNYAFDGCKALAAMTVATNNPDFSSVDGVLFDKTANTLIQYPRGKAGSYTIPNSVTRIEDWAFYDCDNLTSVTIPDNVSDIGSEAFDGCNGLTNATLGNGVRFIGNFVFIGCRQLTSVCFLGNAPSLGSGVFFNLMPIVYYLPGTTGWGMTFGGRPTALWTLPYPLILNRGPSFGVQKQGFGFTISWATNRPVVIQSCANLAQPIWQPLQTNALTGGTNYFIDSEWTNYPSRFYRISSP